MKKMIKLISIAVLFVLFLTGCANKIEPTPNKIVNDLSKLKKSPLSENTYYYIKKGTDFTKYNNIIVPQIKVYTAKNKEGAQKVVDDLSNYFTSEVKNKTEKKLFDDISLYFTTNLQKNLQEVVENKSSKKNSLIFNASIISLDVSYDNLEIYQFLPYGLVFTALKRGTGIEERKLRVNFALKIIEKDTNETIVALIEHNISNSQIKSSKELKIDDLKPILDKWIKKYTLRLNELKIGKYKI